MAILVSLTCIFLPIFLLLSLPLSLPLSSFPPSLHPSLLLLSVSLAQTIAEEEEEEEWTGPPDVDRSTKPTYNALSTSIGGKIWRQLLAKGREGKNEGGSRGNGRK